MRPDKVIEKHAAGKDCVGFRFHGDDLPAGTTIVSAICSVAPTGLTIETTAHVNTDADGIHISIEGGTAGTDYFITFVATRSDGRNIIAVLLVKVI